VSLTLGAGSAGASGMFCAIADSDEAADNKRHSAPRRSVFMDLPDVDPVVQARVRCDAALVKTMLADSSATNAHAAMRAQSRTEILPADGIDAASRGRRRFRYLSVLRQLSGPQSPAWNYVQRFCLNQAFTSCDTAKRTGHCRRQRRGKQVLSPAKRRAPTRLAPARIANAPAASAPSSGRRRSSRPS